MRKVVSRLSLLGLATLAVGRADAQSSVSTYSYDGLGRISQVQAGNGVKSTYQHDSADNRSGASVNRQFETAWEGESLPHGTGYADMSGWAANVSYPNAHMTYGPYIPAVPTGARVATWRMLIDSNTNPGPDTVVVLDVWDSTSNETLASRSLTWTSFAAAFAYQVFELPFTMDASRAGHYLEFRTYYTSKAYINVDKIGYY